MAIKSLHKLVHIHRFTWSGGSDSLICLAKPYGPPLFDELYPQRLHVKGLCLWNFIQEDEYNYLPFDAFFNCQKHSYEVGCLKLDVKW